MTDLNELLERVKEATGPDDDESNPDWRMRRREFDGELWSLGFDVVRDNYRQHPYWEPKPGTSWELVPQVTASIDAALALVERVLPGWGIETINPAGSAYGASRLYPGDHRNPEMTAFGKAKTVPLAILAALLSALISKESRL